MRSGVLAALALALAACKPDPDGGTTIVPAIVGGTAVVPGKLLNVVGLTYDHAREPLCTGALIAPDMVLTAAHCICGQGPTNIVLGHDPVGSGRFYVAGQAKPALHCGQQTSSTGIDIAVVPIAGRVGIAAPLALADEAEIGEASKFSIVGYGATDIGGTVFDYMKRSASIPLVSASCSGAGEVTKFGCQVGQEIVAGRRDTADTCLGDSGAPVLINTSLTGLDAADWRIAGVTSRGVNATHKCGVGGIYERVSIRRAWIQRTMAELRAANPTATHERRADTGSAHPQT